MTLHSFQCIFSAAAVALTVSGQNRRISRISRLLKSFLWESLKNPGKIKVSGGRISDDAIGGVEEGYGGAGGLIICIYV